MHYIFHFYQTTKMKKPTQKSGLNSLHEQRSGNFSMNPKPKKLTFNKIIHDLTLTYLSFTRFKAQEKQERVWKIRHPSQRDSLKGRKRMLKGQNKACAGKWT